jgi:cytochrome c-type biogenesis protein CcmH
MRQRIAKMQSEGKTDDAIVAQIVREEGAVALASPPNTGLGIFTWIMPGIALLIGFFIYQRWVRRNRKPAAVSAQDQALIEQYREQMDREIEP